MTGDIENAAIDRTLRTYFLMHTLTDGEAAQAREQLASYIGLVFSAGEQDLDRLTMCGLTFLRDRNGRGEGASVHSEYTGL